MRKYERVQSTKRLNNSCVITRTLEFVVSPYELTNYEFVTWYLARARIDMDCTEAARESPSTKDALLTYTPPSILVSCGAQAQPRESIVT